MKKLLLALCLAAFLQGCAGATRCPSRPGEAGALILVSDVDDTVKATNVERFFASARNAWSGRFMFAGMNELYRGLLGEAGSLEFVSNAPTLLQKRVARHLDAAGFPGYRLTLRGNVTNGRFKQECLQAMHGASTSRFLLIGDDTEHDPEVYEEFRQGRDVAAVYIHRITGRAFGYGKRGMTLFTTAYDIALHEHRADPDRLTLEEAEAVGEAVLTAPDAAFFPAFQRCPDGPVQSLDLPERLARLQALIGKRIGNLCTQRRRAAASGHG